ncbi:right-handed parallel beta-helix repeat-containing protein [Providencia huaxiensis]|uniref:right-handed parallel beta-helix repeat-containing protein n=1 Tax=Providencia huaxiensis TaxID=2027290 RepID=UPI0032DB455C
MNKITNCHISNCGTGIYFENGITADVTNCKIINCNVGLDLHNESKIKISSTFISENKIGVKLRNDSHIEKVKKTGRNHPCPCLSGKKFKKCCMP